MNTPDYQTFHRVEPWVAARRGALMQGRTRKANFPPPGALRLIYVALIFGVVVFAAVVRLAIEPIGTYSGTTVRLVWLAVAAACTLAAGYLKTRLMRPSAGESQPGTGAVVVWALAESQALVGIVTYMLTGDLPVFWCSLALFSYLFARYRPAVFLASNSGR